MTHENEQAQMFYILKNIDYSKKWEDIEYDLGYDLGDHIFQSKKTAMPNLMFIGGGCF